MSIYNETEFENWYNSNSSELSRILKEEKGIDANPFHEKKRTKIESEIIYMTDPEDPEKIVETLLVQISNEEITSSKALLPEDHLDLVNEKARTYPVSELLVQVDTNSKIVDHNLRLVPNLNNKK